MNDTIRKNLSRVEELVDHDVQYTPEGIPLFNWLELSPIDRCNRSCTFCPRSDPSVAPNQSLLMTPGLYRKLASELGELNYEGTVMLAGYGEPMLSKHLEDMIQVFAPVSRVEVVTNGDCLTREKLEKMAAAGVDQVLISLYDGPDQVDYFQEMVSSSNVPEGLVILRDRWYREDVDFGLKLTNRAGTVRIGQQAEIDISQPCYYPHYSMMIDWNGNAYLCPQDWHRCRISGNVMLHSMLDVWTSKELNQCHNKLGEGSRDMEPCQGCNADGTLHGHKHKIAWDEYYLEPNVPRAEQFACT